MKVTIKGQVTIPRNIRRKLGITPYTEVDFIEEDDRVYLIRRRGKENARGKFSKLRGLATVDMTTDQIMALTRAEE